MNRHKERTLIREVAAEAAAQELTNSHHDALVGKFCMAYLEAFTEESAQKILAGLIRRLGSHGSGKLVADLKKQREARKIEDYRISSLDYVAAIYEDNAESVKRVLEGELRERGLYSPGLMERLDEVRKVVSPLCKDYLDSRSEAERTYLQVEIRRHLSKGNFARSEISRLFDEFDIVRAHLKKRRA